MEDDHEREINEYEEKITKLEAKNWELIKKCTKLEGSIEILERQFGHNHELSLTREQLSFWLLKGAMSSKQKTKTYTTSFGRELFS